MKFTYITAVVAALMVSVEGHSWIDVLTVVSGPKISEKGFNTTASASKDSGLGYIRGMSSKRIDTELTYSIAGTTTSTAGMPACRVGQKTRNDQASGFPRLNAAPGSTVQASYTENGHITFVPPEQASPGTIYWYGTATPKDDEILDNVTKWNKAGTGGDKRGRLLGTTDFDDGKCVENFDPKAVIPQGKPQKGVPSRTAEGVRRNNAGQAGPCKSQFEIPKDVKVGSVYTVYWVWDYSEHFGKKGTTDQVETYTSCMDINIVAGANKIKRELVRSAKFRLD